ncbi:DoxX family protein [Anaeromyxobacter sp. PSR-1]|uniref:DoxX family protein n=1 Tax=Anaeromyxobacter sp. PSR-1 TaxID=1300915 RepID=UPI0005E3672D|nr:DoxX family protein [Anaeromyxobacter sp. PSR-1]GAO02215.1 doxX protein [Anaeromyxobacter sp. PSR-1]
MADRDEIHGTAPAYWALRIALGVVPIVAGLDKFTNLLADWAGYLSPLAVRLLPVSPAAFMRAAGVIEVIVGIGILAGRARTFGWIAMAWLAAIALNLIASGAFLDVAARDAVMAVAAFALARLAAVHEPLRARRPAGAVEPQPTAAHPAPTRT